MSNEYTQFYRGEREDIDRELFNIEVTVLFLNKQYHITKLINNTPFVIDTMFIVNNNSINNYTIDIGHYIFRTIRKLTKKTDTLEATNEAFGFTNSLISVFIQTEVFDEFKIALYKGKDYTTQHIDRMLKIANETDDPIIKIKWIVCVKYLNDVFLSN